MMPPYQFTPYMLPMLACAAFSIALAFYGWRRRTVPGALPFAILMAFDSLWAMGAAIGLAAVDVSTKIFWFQFQFFWQGPVIVAGLCFVLDYARLNRFLNRRNLGLLFAFVLVSSLLILTNNVHHWIWLDFNFDGAVRPLRGNGGLILTLIGLSLSILGWPILIWLFIRSPQHRLPVAIMLFGQIVVRTAYLLDAGGINPFAPMDFAVLSMNFSSVMYVIALFGFRIFDPIPMARRTVIEQMQEGMLVLDSQWQIVDLNPAAEKILGVRTMRVRGRKVTQVLPAYLDSPAQLDQPGIAHSEITLGTGAAARIYALHLSPLSDQRGFLLGYLLLLRDMTEQKQAQAQLLEQQRALAVMDERERLARELHDSVGQTLGYVSMQAQAIRKRVHDGDAGSAESQLTRLAEVAQDAHADIRESILSLKTTPAQEWSFLATLKQHLALFENHYGVATALQIAAGLGEQTFAPNVQVQLLRVIQEALTNARKHGRAHHVQITFERQDSQVRIVIADDGCGFDVIQLAAGVGDHFGLAFMRERMAQISGDMTIHSQPGAGTQVVFQFPMLNSG